MHPYLFKIGSFELRIYSLMLIIAVLTGIYFTTRRAKALGHDSKFIENAMIATFVGGIIGARLYYVIFNWNYFGANLGEILAVWHGGLAIHGGIIAGILSAWLFCRYKKFSLFTYADLIAPFILIGQGLGRFGNFANGEAHGVPTITPPSVIFRIKPAFQEFWQNLLSQEGVANAPEQITGLYRKIISSPVSVQIDGQAQTLKEFVPWGISFPSTYRPQAWLEFGSMPVHPTFFYEMILNFCFGAFLIFLWRKGKYIGSGRIFALYLCAYALIRSFVTFFRADDLMLGPLRAPHVASIGLIIFAGIWLFQATKRMKSV